MQHTIISQNLLQFVARVPIKRGFLFNLLNPFNKVDPKRVEEVGPNCACAEWLVKNGAAIKWEGSTRFTKNYDSLFGSKHCKLYEVDATGSSISDAGFPHFENIQSLRSLILSDCLNVGDQALWTLRYVKLSLKQLTLKNMPLITDKGLSYLEELESLENLKISHLPGVNNLETFRKEFQARFRNCKIDLES